MSDTGNKRGAQILVVEDERIIAENIRNKLVDLGYRVPAVAVSGEEAVATVGAIRPDLVLMDIRLRGEMDGVEAADQIRARFGVPVVYLTAYADEETLLRAKITRPFGYLVKPVETREMRSTIEMALYSHQLEQNLRQNEERYRHLVEVLPDAVVIHRDEKILWANTAGARIFGAQSPDQLVGKSVLPFVHADYREVAAKRLQNIRGTGKDLPVTRQKLVKLDGTSIDAEVATIPFAYQAEPATLTVVRDITEWVQADQEIKQRRRYLEGVLAAVPDAIITLGADRKVVEWNPGAERLFGYTRDEAVGRDVDKLVAQPDVFEEAARFTQAALQGQCVGPVSSVRYRKDGSPRDVLVAGSPVYTDREPTGLVAVYTDISERVRAERMLEQRAAQLALLNDIGGKVAAVLDLDRVLDTAVRLVQKSFGYHHVGIFILDRDRGELVMKARAGSLESLFPVEHRVKLNEGMVGWVGQHGQMILANDVDAEPRYVNYYPHLIPTRSELSVPVRVGDAVAGVLDIQSPERDAFDENDVTVIEILAGQVAVAMENARLHGALKELKEFNERIVQNMTEGIAVTDAEGRVLFMNPAGAHMLGYEPEELIGQSQFSHIAPDQHLLVEEAERRRARGESDRYDLELVCKDGSRITVQVSGNPRFEAGRFSGTLAIFTDITRRVQAEEVLRQRNQELALLNHATRAFSSSLALDHVLVTVLDEVRRVLGVTACSVWLLDRERQELVCQESTGPHSEVVKGWRLVPGEGLVGWAVEHGKSLIISDVAADRRHYKEIDRRTRWEVRSTLVVPLRVRDDVFGALQVVDKDPGQFTEADLRLIEPLAGAAAIAIENARLVEGLGAEVARRTAQIRAEQEKSEAILRSVGDAIGVCSQEFRLEYVNEAFSTLTGYAAEEAIGSPLHVFVQQDLAQTGWEALRECVTSGRIWRGETTFRRKDGRTYDAFLTIAPMHDAEETLIGYVSSHQDVSRQKELERARNQFITNVSHQLRTPVTNIKLYAQLLQKRRYEEKADYYLQVLQNQADGLTELVQDILEITELDSGEGVTAWETIQLPTLARDVVTCYHSQAISSGLTLDMAPLHCTLPIVKGDQRRLGQALGELVQNALIFTPAGGHVTVKLDVIQGDGDYWVEIAVQDTGPGIAPDEQERIFDRFFRGRLAASGHVPGTGLGLSMVQEIVRAHGGLLTVDSELGVGSCFAIWLRGRSPEAA